MKQSGRAANSFASRSLILLVFPFAAIGVAWFFLMPPVPEQPVDPVAEAVAALDTGDIETAFQIVQQLHSASADSEVTYLMAVIEGLRGNSQHALEVIQELPDFQADPRLLTMAAQFALAVPRLSVAGRLLDRALKVDPENEEAVRILVSLEGNLLNIPKVRTLIAHLDRLDKATAEDVFLYCSGSRVNYDLYENVKRLEPAYRNEPDQGEIAYALVNNLLAMNRLADAQQVIDAAAARTSTSNGWLIRLAQAELAVISDDFSQAAKSLLEIRTSGENSAAYWIVLGRVLKKQEAFGAAVQAYRNAAQLAPFDPEPVYALSRLLARSSPSEAELMKKRTRLLQQLSVQVEAVVSLDSFEEAVERFPLIVEKLVDAGAYREARVCLNWLKSEGYRSREATAQDERLQHLASPPPLELVPPSASELLAVDTSSLVIGQAGTSAAQDLISFVDVTDELNVQFQYVSPSDANTTILTSLGGGVAALDFDCDGVVDLFFPQGGSLPGTNRRPADGDCLLRRRQDVFVDVSSIAIPETGDYGHGAAAGDANADGFSDLFVTNFGLNQLLLNNGDGTFTDATVDSGLRDSEWSVSSAFEDFDHDGDLDIYVVNYLTINVEEMEACTDERSTPCGPLNVPACQDRLYENLSNGRFRDVTGSSGIVVPDGKGLGVVVRDFDGDGRTDIFVGNDTTHNRLFFNQSTDQQLDFQEASASAGVAVGGDGKSEACMGIASADLDNNGFPEIFVTNFEGETNTLYTNLGGRTFVDNTESMELGRSSYTVMGWGTQFLDIDGDSMLDLVVLNGHLHNDAMLANIYLQKNARFNSPSSYHGDYFDEPWLGRAIAVADFNRDARPDLIVTHRTGKPRILLNQSGTRQRFAIRLIATNSHRNALGTTVSVKSDDSVVTRVLRNDGGYLAANERALWFVVPKSGVVDTLSITWPSGHRQQLHNLTPQTDTTIVETDTEDARLMTLPQ
jgi:tetratricopeptide (TPR) repeat protein